MSATLSGKLATKASLAAPPLSRQYGKAGVCGARRPRYLQGMTLHLIKLCVGADSVDDLRRWWAQEAAAGRGPVCDTRQTPKRADELTDGGSLYWVVRGVVLVRQAIVSVDTFGQGAAGRCAIALSPELVLTAPQPRRPFQGWRYLKAEDAPPDLSAAGDAALPQDLAGRLREIGAW